MNVFPYLRNTSETWISTPREFYACCRERKPRKPQPKREIVTIFTIYSPVENTHNCITFVSQSSQDKLMTMDIHFLGGGEGERGAKQDVLWDMYK